jgi:hypothetical protein
MDPIRYRRWAIEEEGDPEPLRETGYSSVLMPDVPVVVQHSRTRTDALLSTTAYAGD